MPVRKVNVLVRDNINSVYMIFYMTQFFLFKGPARVFGVLFVFPFQRAALLGVQLLRLCQIQRAFQKEYRIVHNAQLLYPRFYFPSVWLRLASGTIYLFIIQGAQNQV